MTTIPPVLGRFAEIRPFVAAPAPRVVFGAGTVHTLPEEVAQLGWSRVLVLSTPGQRGLGEQVAGLLGTRAAGLHAGAVMHVPVGSVTDAVAELTELRADACVAVGGGSTIGLAKGIARETGVPYLAVPTTYSGSEMTPVWGLTRDGVKTTGRSDAVRATAVVYDPLLSARLPVATSVTSGLNALAHAAEALYAPDASPLTDAMATAGAEALLGGLPRLLTDPADAAARSGLLAAAWLCGSCLAATTVGLHHKLCHILGGMFDLPHAETHAALLPYSLAHNLTAAPFAARTLAGVLGSDQPASALWQLNRRLGAPTSLGALGLSVADVPAVVAAALGSSYANPRPVTAEGLTALLTVAVAGTDPAALPA
jgi:maleylacetate reductase